MSPATSRARARAWRAIVATAAAAGMSLAAGCEVGPDFQRPAAPEAKGFSPQPSPPATTASDIPGGEAQSFIQGQDIPGQWWTLFHSKPLDALIEQALKANPSLQAAQAALRQARENVYAGQGALFPSVTANASATREKISGASFGLPGLSSAVGITSIGLNLSYTLDVFGGVRRQVESLEAREEYERFQLEATYLTLTSNLAGAAVQEASTRGQIAATEQIIKIERDTLDLLRKQRAAGQIAEADAVAQEAALAQVEQTLPPLQKQLLQNRDLIAALAGGFPSEHLSARFLLAELRLPRDLPVSLPAKLIEQRPDVRMAEENLHAASAQIGVAITNRLPNITLTANAGSTSDAVNTMFGSGTEFWGVTAAVAQPIFHGGTLFHRELAAKDAYDQALAQYRSTVIVAFQNVADSLRAIQTDAVALQKAVASERAALHSLDIVRGRLKLGDVNYLGLLNAEQTYQQAVLSLAQAKAARYADTVSLFQALGGGWWNRQDVEAEKPPTIGDFFR
jgi:NodT family efflux transporter outer membrane factor (OMF) lipoprotein